MSWNCPKTDKPCWQNCRGFECRDRDDDRVTCGGGPPGDPNGEKTALLLEFAQFLHTLPAEDSFDVGPARVKFDAHGATERVLWATQEDTARWVAMFMDRRRA